MSYSSKSKCFITLVEVKAIQTNVLAKGLKVTDIEYTSVFRVVNVLKYQKYK